MKAAVLDFGELLSPLTLDFLLLVFAPVLLGDFQGMTSRKPSIAGAVTLAPLFASGYCLSCPSTAVMSVLLCHLRLASLVLCAPA